MSFALLPNTSSHDSYNYSQSQWLKGETSILETGQKDSYSKKHLRNEKNEKLWEQKRIRLASVKKSSSLQDHVYFLTKLDTWSKQETTLDGRLKLLNTHFFTQKPFSIGISCGDELYRLTYTKKTKEVCFQMLNEAGKAILILRRTADNSVEEVVSPEDNLSIEAITVRDALRQFWDLSEKVTTLSRMEWEGLLISNSQKVEERIRLFKQNFTFVRNPKAEGKKFWWQAWLEVQPPSKDPQAPFPKGIYLQLILTEDKYDSNTFPEEEIFEENSAKKLQQDDYFFIKAFDENDVTLASPIYVFRSDFKGMLAETVYIQSIKDRISGNQMRDLLQHPIKAFFKVDDEILNDASAVEVFDRKLKLRRLRARSWYESMDYIPLDCHQKLLTSGKYITQSSTHYYAAVEKIHNISLSKIYEIILAGYPENRRRLNSIAKRHMQLPTPASYGEVRFMQLVNQVATLARQKENTQAQKDLIYLYDNLLSPFILDVKASSIDQKIYNLALSVIKSTKVFHQPRNREKEQLSFDQFQELSHPSFDELVKEQVVERNISLWKDFILKK